MCLTTSNTRQCYVLQQTYVIWWWNNYLGVYTTHAWMSFKWRSRALGRRGCSSWQLCVLQLKPLEEWSAAESPKHSSSQSETMSRASIEISDPLHVFTQCTNDHTTGGNAKIWNSEGSQKLRWGRCWLTNSSPHCLNRQPRHCTQHGIKLYQHLDAATATQCDMVLYRNHSVSAHKDSSAMPQKTGPSSIKYQLCVHIPEGSAHAVVLFFSPLPPLLGFFSLSGTKNWLPNNTWGQQ